MTQKWELENSEIGSYLLCVFFCFFNLFLATLGLLCCRQLSLVVASQGYSPLLLLMAVNSLLVKDRL